MRQTRIGMLTPSSNTVLEPLTHAMLAGLPDVSSHFSRFPVTEISLSPSALAQFDDRPMLQAAELLADARVDVIGWNGTSSAWLGFEADYRLCDRITATTGIKATTSMLALNEALATSGLTAFSLVSPYLDNVQSRIIENYAKLGITCRSERHLGIRENFAFSTISAETIRDLVQQVAADRPPAIATVCTNMRAALAVDALERELKIPIYDTIAVVLWKCLALADVDPALVTGWGSIFKLPAR